MENLDCESLQQVWSFFLISRMVLVLLQALTNQIVSDVGSHMHVFIICLLITYFHIKIFVSAKKNLISIPCEPFKWVDEFAINGTAK